MALFSPDGQRFATGSADKTARIWEVKSGRPLKALTDNGGWVQQVAFSPDGRTIATGSSDRRARLWDASSGAKLLTMEGHLTGISSLAFSPDGQRLATAGAGPALEVPWLLDNTTIIWDLRTGQRLVKLDAHANTVVTVAFSPDGRQLATGGADNTVRIREAFPWQPEEYLAPGHKSLDEDIESFKRRHWQERLQSPAWVAPLGAPPAQRGRRWETSMYGGVNLPAERGTKTRPCRPIPPRAPDAGTNLIDLSNGYNAALTETWQPTSGLLGVDVNLGCLPAGVRTLGGVTFDVRGVIRLSRSVLNYSVFPAEVKITVGRKFRRLHVLHGAQGTTADGTPVGNYRLHFRDGGSVDLPILYGCDLRDWWISVPTQLSDPVAEATAAEVAWTGPAERITPGDSRVRLFKRTYENPAPDREVAHITFASSLTATGPFLVAMTVE